jgi:hypothetical protein
MLDLLIVLVLLLRAVGPLATVYTPVAVGPVVTAVTIFADCTGRCRWPRDTAPSEGAGRQGWRDGWGRRSVAVTAVAAEAGRLAGGGASAGKSNRGASGYRNPKTGSAGRPAIS